MPSSSHHTPSPRPSFVGLQIEHPCFAGRKPEAVLDEILERAPVNALIVFPNWKAWDGGADPLFRALEKPAAERGIRLFFQMGERAWQPSSGLASPSGALMVDCHGRRLREGCLSRGEWIDFQMAGVENFLREHPFLAGGMFMHERRGPVSALLGGGSEERSRRPYCFCESCRARGAEEGIDVRRAREGFQRLYELFEASARSGDLPAEGWFVTFWRILVQFPEVLAWERLFYDTLHDYRAGLTGSIKALDVNYRVGYHVQNHTMLMDFAWRAGDEPERIAAYADWIKLSVYPAVSGTRGKGRLRKLNRTLFADVPDETGRDFLRGIMGREAADEPDWFADDVPGFAPSWVRKEVARWKKALPDKPVYSGLGIGVPGGEKAETPGYITACTQAGYEGGADGTLLSRNYGEMRPELLKAAGAVIQNHQ